ncbi:MAG TPA: penicillin-binding protein 2 [Solirubrobacteraceae bacterium]|jgi:peptidoglycan glycosyltransferase|nr:penicillin-binding protein 2 [Solirubrobacteraceae bacterium]
MNRPILRIYILVVVLFALLVAFTSRWTVFEASSLRENPLNKRALLEQLHIRRGAIVARTGTVLARSVRNREGNYERTYPTGSEFAQAIGYSYPLTLARTGLERYRNAPLSAESQSNLQSLLDQFQGRPEKGDEVITTLDPAAQRVALEGLGEHEGAVVALEPSTGAVRVMASTPSYDPNTLRSAAGAEKLKSDSESPLLNRAVQYGYAPGSTFKVVTATAAFDTGRFTPSSTLSGRNGIVVSGVPLHNDQNESYGELTLTQALAKSVNTVWAKVAEQVGKPTLAEYMRRFGFDAKPQLDYPAEEMSASGEYQGTQLLSPTSPLVDLGRLGIGQDKLEVAPLQMAEVAAAVANHGTLMAPHLTERIVSPEGSTVQRIAPRVQSVVMKPSTAAAVRSMMEAVVNEGTGENARIPGVQVAGKTGTAETEIGTAINNVWFIAFAPASAPRAAIAVTVKGVPGYGATYALPIARKVLEVLLHE